MSDDTVCMHYMIDRLNGIRTESDLFGLIDELDENIKVNADWRSVNPSSSESFDVRAAIDDVKRDYVRRALARCENVSEAAKLLGLSNYQTLQNWMDKLGVKR